MKHEQLANEIYWAMEHGEGKKVDKLIDDVIKAACEKAVKPLQDDIDQQAATIFKMMVSSAAQAGEPSILQRLREQLFTLHNEMVKQAEKDGSEKTAWRAEGIHDAYALFDRIATDASAAQASEDCRDYHDIPFPEGTQPNPDTGIADAKSGDVEVIHDYLGRTTKEVNKPK